jgi:hypothetical protein
LHAVLAVERAVNWKSRDLVFSPGQVGACF